MRKVKGHYSKKVKPTLVKKLKTTIVKKDKYLQPVPRVFFLRVVGKGQKQIAECMGKHETKYVELVSMLVCIYLFIYLVSSSLCWSCFTPEKCYYFILFFIVSFNVVK